MSFVAACRTTEDTQATSTFAPASSTDRVTVIPTFAQLEIDLAQRPPGLYFTALDPSGDLELFDMEGNLIGRFLEGEYVLPSINTDYSRLSYISLDGTFCIEEILSGAVACLPYDMSRLHSSWSPDGDFIVLDAVDEQSGEFLPHLRIIEVQSLQEWRIDFSELDQREPEWSRVGQQIVFQSSHLRDPYVDLFILDRRCVEQPADCVNAIRGPINPPEYIMFGPSWSPDAKKISAGCARIESDIPSDYRLCVLEVESGEVTELPESTTNAQNSSWSPDGQWIAYEDGVGQVFAIRPDGSDVREIAPRTTFGFWIWVTN